MSVGRSAGPPHRGAALDKKARDVVVLDMRDVVSYTDYLVICTGNTERQTKAIQEGIYQEPEARGDGQPERARSGSRGGRRRAGS